MDIPQSIITQVHRDDDSIHMPLPSIVEKVPKKLKTRNFFWKLLCCVKPQTGGCVSQQHTFSPTQTSLLPLTLNTDDLISTKTSSETFLLSEQCEEDRNKKCVVIDLDETLVHSSFAPVHNADFIIPVEIDGTIHQVYVLKRPYVDEFLERMGQLFECVLFTASLGKYADPVTDLLDTKRVFRTRLFRESCVFHCGSYVKDLSRLGRDLCRVAILDNSPASYLFHPRNAVSVASWFDNPLDRELLNLIPFFEDLATCPDVYSLLDSINNRPTTPLSPQHMRPTTPLQETLGEGVAPD